jgi:hypothetical protein
MRRPGVAPDDPPEVLQSTEGVRDGSLEEAPGCDALSMAMCRSATGPSYASTPVDRMARGRHRASARAWTFVLRPLLSGVRRAPRTKRLEIVVDSRSPGNRTRDSRA